MKVRSPVIQSSSGINNSPRARDLLGATTRFFLGFSFRFNDRVMSLFFRRRRRGFPCCGFEIESAVLARCGSGGAPTIAGDCGSGGVVEDFDAIFGLKAIAVKLLSATLCGRARTVAGAD